VSTECLALIGQEPDEEHQQQISEDSHLRQSLSLWSVHILAFFILVYVGVEVTIGGKP
jgi:fucose permease